MVQETADRLKAAFLRHPLPMNLVLAMHAMLGRTKSLYIIAQWGRRDIPPPRTPRTVRAGPQSAVRESGELLKLEAPTVLAGAIELETPSTAVTWERLVTVLNPNPPIHTGGRREDSGRV